MRRLLHKYRNLAQPVFSVYGRWKNWADGRIVRQHYPDVDIVPSRDPEAPYASQHGQDRYLAEAVMEGATTGVFVDIGCNHPVQGSNSWFFEQQGWTGYAFDPIQRFADLWREKRSTPFINAAVAETVDKLEFVEFEARYGWEHQLSSFKDFVDPAHLSSMPHTSYIVNAGPVSHHCPDLSHVDLALIDVEGAELLVLRGLFAGGLFPRWILMENNAQRGGSEQVRLALIEQGYSFKARIAATDDLFIRRDQ
ncbi:MAG: FkbM family methyltransferase [Pseudomonadota bacterium]